MPFVFGPREESGQERPQSVLDRIPKSLLRFPASPAPEEDPQTGELLPTTRRLAEILLGDYRAQPASPTSEPAEPAEIRPATTQEASLGGPERVRAFTSGLRRGWQMMLAGAGGTIEDIAEMGNSPDQRPQSMVELFGPLYETEDHLRGMAENYGRGLREGAMERIQEISEASPEGHLNWAIGVIGEMLPLVATALVPSVGTRLAGASVATATEAGLMAAIGTSYPVEKAFLRTSLEEEGLDSETADNWATVAAGPIAALEGAWEGFAAGRFAGRLAGEATEGFFGEGLKKTFAKRVAQIARETAEGQVVEGGTEGLQEVISLATEAAATGEVPDPAEALYQIGLSTAAGAVGGGFFGAGFGTLGQISEAHKARVGEAKLAQVRAQAAAFDPAAVEPGTEVAGKRKVQLANGQTRWRDVETNLFTSAPQATDVQAVLETEIKDAQALADTDLKTSEDIQPLDIPIERASAKLASLTERDIDPGTVELNVRNLAVNWLSSASNLVRRSGRTEAEIQTELADLELIALDPSTDTDYATRVTALAKKRAIEYALRQSPRQAVEAVDTSIGARKLASLDEPDFQSLSELAEASNNELYQKTIREARALRDRRGQLAPSQADQLNDRLALASQTRSRGLGPGSRIELGGRVGQVQNVRDSGFVDVIFDGDDTPSPVDPATLNIIPTPGSKVRLRDGQVLDVVEVGESQMRLRLPDGGETVISTISPEIQSISDSPAQSQALTEEQVAQEPERTVEALPASLEAVDTRTGQIVSLDALGPEWARDESGDLIPRSALEFDSRGHLIEDITTSGVVPTFQPGTQPSQPNSHINFIQIPETFAPALEGAAQSGPKVFSAFLTNLPEGAGLYLFPQPTKSGTVLYAVELPSGARELTPGSKKVLGFLGGKSANITQATLRSRVRFQPPQDPSQLGLYRVPEGLRTAANASSQISQLDSEAQRALLRRLTDLGFQLDAETSQALTELGEVAKTAQDTRIEGRAGEAEVAETQTVVKRAEAAQASIEKDIADRRRAWETIKDILNDSMSPTEASMLELLNSSTVDNIARVPGISRAVAEEIVAASEGGLETINDLLNVKGVGPARLRGLREALQAGEVQPGDRIGESQEQAIKIMLESMPGRRGSQADNWLLSFSHPDIPGLTLVLDKETVESAVPDEEGNLQTVERDLYHIRYITPELAEIRARTIGTELTEVEIPAHLVQGQVGPRGYADSPPAIKAINHALSEGRSIDGILDELQRQRRTVKRVTLKGRATLMARLEDGSMVDATELTDDQASQVVDAIPTEQTFTVIEEEDETMVVEDESGERFEIPTSDVAKKLGESQEPMVPFQISRRLSPSEALGEVVREIRKFDKRAHVLSTGEWRSNVPGVYGEVRPTSDGRFRAAILDEPQTRTLRRPRLYQIANLEVFDTRAEAEAWLTEHDFHQTPFTSPSKDFQALPAVEELSLEDLGLHRSTLFKILDYYRVQGFLPQPVRDYAVRFAVRWHQAGLPSGYHGVYDSLEINRMLNLFTLGELRSAQQSQHINPLGRTLANAGDLRLESGKVVVPARSPAELATDIRLYDGILLSPALEPTHPAKLETAKALYEADENRQRFLDLAGSDAETLQEISDRLVHIGPGGRLGVVVDSRPGTDELVVQTFESGEPSLSTIHKGDAIRVTDPRKALDWRRAARDNLQELQGLPATPEMGDSPLDERFGLAGITDIQHYKEGLRRKVGQILQKVKIAEDGNLSGDPRQIENLRDIWIRMKELGIKNRDFHASLDDPGGDFFARFGDTLAQSFGLQPGQYTASQPLIPPVLTRPIGDSGFGVLDDLAYDEIANTFSNVSPYGDILARAKLGKLSTRQRKQIEEQSKLYNAYPDLPLYRKVEFLIQNVWDPQTAHLLYQMRRDMGALAAIGDGAVPPGGLELRMPAMGSSVHTNAAAYFTTPREMANRHPTFRTFFYLSEKARTAHGNRVKRGTDIIHGLQALGKGMSLDRKKVIWDLLQSETLGDAMDRPSEILTRDQIVGLLGEDSLPKDWDWYRQYRTLRTLAVEARRDNIRNGLVRGFHAEEIAYNDNLSPDEVIEFAEKLKAENDLTDAEVTAIKQRIQAGEKIYNLDRNSNAAYARPRSEVEAFLNLTDQYRTLREIPQETRNTMKEWMIDEFDFWARYGLNNYAPKILQGRHKIFMEDPDGGDPRLVAFAPDGATAQEFFFRTQRGQVPGIPSTAKLFVEFGHAIGDYEGDIQFLGSQKFARLYARLTKDLEGVDGLAAQLGRTLSQELRIGGEPAAPRDLHTQARVADLSDIIEDPYERMLYYWGRTSRNNYLLDVEHAYETARGMDAAISRAEGIEAIFPSDRYGESGHAVMMNYMDDQRDSFMGKPTKGEKIMNKLVALANGFTVKPTRKAIARLKQGMKDPNYDLFSDPAFLETLYNEDYASRKWAESLTTVQSVWRLGLNLAGAAINSTQHLVFTPSYLVSRGDTVVDAVKYSVQGYLDALKYWKGSQNPNNELALFAERAGVATVPVRGFAGPGLGISGGKPLYFSDDGPLVKVGKFLEWAAMFPFAKAERSVRLASTFAARRSSQKRDLSEGAAVTFARQTVDNTQYQYYDQALPPAMRSPLARVLFQFQPFVINAIKSEKDMLRGALPASFPLARAGTLEGSRRVRRPDGTEVSASAQARKAWLLYNATGLLFGGLAWEAARPLFAGFNWLAKALIGQNLEQALANAFGGGEDRIKEQYGTAVGDPDLLTARNFALYGLPGLLGLQISNRLGVSGLDLDPSRFSDMALGPSGALFRDTQAMLFGDEGFKRANKPATLIGLGVGLGSQFVGLRFPLGSLAGPLAAIEATSLATGTPLHDFLFDSEAGRRYFRAMSPTLVRGLNHTIDVFDGVAYEPNFQRREYPGSLNRLFESATSIAGFQTIRSAEERALLQYKLHVQEDRQFTRSLLISRAATAAASQGMNSRAVVDIIKQSVEMGAHITRDDIQRAIQRRQLGPVEKVEDRGSAYLRGMGRSNPGGR